MFGGLVVKAFVWLIDAGADDRMPHFLYKAETDLIVRDANANGILLCHGDFRDKFGCGQSKGIGSWKQPFHHLVGIIGNMGIAADVLQVGADETERFLPLHLLQSMNLPDRFLVDEITTQTIDSVRGVPDDPSLFQNFAP